MRKSRKPLTGNKGLLSFFILILNFRNCFFLEHEKGNPVRFRGGSAAVILSDRGDQASLPA